MTSATVGRGKIVLLNDNHDPTIERTLLEAAGYSLQSAVCATEDEVIAAAQDAVGIINVYARITPRVAAALKQCKVMVRPGVGYDLIDVAACRANGIQVCYLPDYCIDEVADHAVALLMAVQRRLRQNLRNVEQGVWDGTLVGPVRRLNRLTLGIIGLGKIGRRFAAKLREIIPTQIAYDPYLPDALFAEARLTKATLEMLFRESDVIAIFAPLTAENRYLIRAETIRQMVRRPIVVNVSRGGQINTKDLIAALKSGAISGAGLDVLETEPVVDRELASLENVMITPHFGWFSVEAETENRTRTAQEIIRVLAGEPPRNPVP